MLDLCGCVDVLTLTEIALNAYLKWTIPNLAAYITYKNSFYLMSPFN